MVRNGTFMRIRPFGGGDFIDQSPLRSLKNWTWPASGLDFGVHPSFMSLSLQRKTWRTFPGLAIALMVGAFLLDLVAYRAVAQSPTTNVPWVYKLLGDSYLLDECLPCGIASRPVPMKGGFNLRLAGQTPFSTHYVIEGLQFEAVGFRTYRVSGGGTLNLNGDFALTFDGTLAVEIDDGTTNRTDYFTNSTSFSSRRWPIFDLTFGQTNGTLVHTLTLRLVAAPVRDIWYSVATSFAADDGNPTTGFIRGGDLLSMSGRVVKRNADLFTSVGAFPPGPDLGLDAIDVLPGGEIAFSLGSGITSQTLGQLQGGDLLSNKGRIISRNQDLLAAFATSTTNDAGLDAVHVLDSGEIYFSIASDVFSTALGVTLHRGDLLSSNGNIVRSNHDLLSRFQPADPSADYGLNAIYIWPGGETWFSTEKGFMDSSLGSVAAGDLLSDNGYIVFRNADLVSVFQPNPSLGDLGLDALYVITDATPPAPAPTLSLQTDTAAAGVGLRWTGKGRVFQVERADALSSPFYPLSPILPDLHFDDAGSLTNSKQHFYRLLEW